MRTMQELKDEIASLKERLRYADMRQRQLRDELYQYRNGHPDRKKRSL